MKINDEMKKTIIKLDNEGVTSREIAELCGIGKSTCGDFLRKETYQVWWAKQDTKVDILGKVVPPYKDDHASESGRVIGGDTCLNLSAKNAEDIFSSRQIRAIHPEVYSIATTKDAPVGATQLMIPDTQCKPDISFEYLRVLGEYIVDKQPEVIVHIGDHADMPSLSSYDKGKKAAEGKRVNEDIQASIDGMNALLKPLYDLQQAQLKEHGKVLYTPKMVLTLGNHEHRIVRHVEASPELSGFLSYDNLRYEESGWEVHDFLKPVIINGVSYVHFMANPMTGKPYGGAVLGILKNVGESFCMGHKQCLDVATRFLPASGKQQWGIIAGAYYEHDEAYKGHQGNHHWRGIVVKHQVKEGSFEPMFVSMEYLLERYKK